MIIIKDKFLNFLVIRKDKIKSLGINNERLRIPVLVVGILADYVEYFLQASLMLVPIIACNHLSSFFTVVIEVLVRILAFAWLADFYL